MDVLVEWAYNPTFMLIIVSEDGRITCSATMDRLAAYSVTLKEGEFSFVTPITSWAMNAG